MQKNQDMDEDMDHAMGGGVVNTVQLRLTLLKVIISGRYLYNLHLYNLLGFCMTISL